MTVYLGRMRTTKLTTLIMKSLDEDATTALLELTARSVISPLIWKMEQNKWNYVISERSVYIYATQPQLTSWPRQLARQKAVSIAHILTRRSSEPVIT